MTLNVLLCCRFEEARTALFRALDSRELFGVPLLVLANKQDLQDAQPPEAVQQMLGLDELKVPFRWAHRLSARLLAASVFLVPRHTSHLHDRQQSANAGQI